MSKRRTIVKRKTNRKTDRKNNKNKKSKLNHNQKGGEKLGHGGFGCVIRPPVKCTTPFNKTHYRRNPNYVSKIIKHTYHQTAFNELSIGQEIIKLDPFAIYFSPIINGCFFTPEFHPDIQYAQSSYSSKIGKSSDLTITRKTEKRKTEKQKIKTQRTQAHLAHKCFIDKHEPHFNLIGKYGGQNLHYYLSRISSLPESVFIKKEPYYIFYHLSKAINILHNKKILHKDIKLSNITVNFSQTLQKKKRLESFHSKTSSLGNKRPIINLIDFGLSVKLPKKATIEEFYKLIKNGTHNYIPPEIYVMKTIIKLGKTIQPSKTPNFEKIVKKKVEDEFVNYRYYLSKNGFARNGFSLENIQKKNQSNIITKDLEDKMIHNLVNIYLNNEHSEEFLGHSFLLNWDVYSLGLVFSKIVQKIKLDDKRINKLISDMVAVDYKKRITSKEIIKLNLFKGF